MQITNKQIYSSTCSYCGVGCGVLVKKTREGKLSVEGDPEYPVNQGMLCSKGKNLHYVASDYSDRLTFPEMRWNRNLPLMRVDWDTAIERAARVFSTFREKFGPDSVGFYVSGQCLTEEYYVVNKLTKGFLGTNNIDTNSRLCMSTAVAAYKIALGEDSVPLSYEDIDIADCFFIAGANPAWCHPILFRRLENRKSSDPEVKIIVADPRKTQSTSIADLHLQLKPGTDVALFKGIARSLVESEKLDQEFIRLHTDGIGEYLTDVMRHTVREYADISGTNESDIRLAASYIGGAKGFITFWAMGLNQSVIGVNKNLSLINLSLITGKIGKPGCGPFSLTGQPNAMGGREVGGLSNLLPAHRNLNNPQHRKDVADFWKVPSIPEKPGLTATEMFEALETGKMKAIWIICTNPLVSLPDLGRVEKALRNAKFVIVQDISRNSDTVKFADLVLPAAGWLEKEGTMTNSERRISFLEKVIDPPGEALADTEILCRFARKMNFPGFDFKNNSEIYSEHCALTEGTNIDISGLSYEYLMTLGSVQWPFPKNATIGTKRLFTDHKFYTPNSNAQIKTVPMENFSENTSNGFPLILTTGRIRDQWHTMTKTGKVEKLRRHIPKPFLEIHPNDAKNRDIGNEDLVEILNKRGSVRVRATITENIREGTVFLPMHWGKILGNNSVRTNNLTNNLVDPVSKEPDFKFSAVEVKKFKKSRQKIVIIGSGAAAFRFITAYRENNPDDEIVVFGKEKTPFYNRVLLPEYISKKTTWQQLQKISENDFMKMNIIVNSSTGVKKIDRNQKVIITDSGKKESYDILILATGSRPVSPGDIQDMPGIFTLRSREDADRISEYLPSGRKAVIIGGGLLGLELASVLNELGVSVTVIQRSSRLMDRQLDDIASDILYEELVSRGIEILLNERLHTVRGQENVIGVRLSSGRIIDSDALIFAIGTTPNIELAKDAGLDCERGILVDAYMRTNDEKIFAIGEIAQFQDTLYGITLAAEQQAEKAAGFLSGDDYSFYSGSVSMNILKVSDLSLCSIGLSQVPQNGDGYEEILFYDRTQRYYKKCIVYGDKLVGAVLIGDRNEFQEFKELIESKLELGEKRLELLRSAAVPRKITGKLICSCNSVGEGNIREEIRKGCVDIKELSIITGAGTGCGSCKPELKFILEEELVKS